MADTHIPATSDNLQKIREFRPLLAPYIEETVKVKDSTARTARDPFEHGRLAGAAEELLGLRDWMNRQEARIQNELQKGKA